MSADTELIGIKLFLEVDKLILKLQSINPAFGPPRLLKALRVMELSCPFKRNIQTPIIEVTINQYHQSKRSLIGERNHSAENPGFLNG